MPCAIPAFVELRVFHPLRATARRSVAILRRNDGDLRPEREQAETNTPAREDRRSTHLWASHRASHDSGNDGENDAAGTTSGDLTEQRTDIQSTGAARDRWQQRLQHLTEDAAANRSSDGVAEHAKAIVLERCTGHVAADRAGH